MPKGGCELIDVGDGFFLAKFEEDADLCFALEEGTWIRLGHYLTHGATMLSRV